MKIEIKPTGWHSAEGEFPKQELITFTEQEKTAYNVVLHIIHRPKHSSLPPGANQRLIKEVK